MASDVKWIKIVTDIFDDEKVSLIESMPEPDSIIVIWFKILCLAGKNNNKGVLLLNERIPYTEEMLSTIFHRPLNTIRLSLRTFEQYGMIEIVNDIITIPNWGKHQTLDQLENKREYMRTYMATKRNEQKKIANGDEPLTLLDSCKSNSKANCKTNVSTLDKTKKEIKSKNKYGEYKNVLLTNEEYQRLLEEQGQENLDKIIDYFDKYIEEKGNKSKSHNLAIRRWVIDAVINQTKLFDSKNKKENLWS